jgi:hypothetical protein
MNAHVVHAHSHTSTHRHRWWYHKPISSLRNFYQGHRPHISWSLCGSESWKYKGYLESKPRWAVNKTSSAKNKFHYRMYDWLQTGFRLLIVFIEHLQIATTSNYSSVANSHALQFTTANIKSFQFSSVHVILLLGSCSPRLAATSQQASTLPTVLLLLCHAAVTWTAYRKPLPTYFIVACYECVA